MREHLTSTGDGAFSTKVWDERTCPRNYSGITYEHREYGEFSIFEWSSRQGKTLYWRGLHVRYPNEFPESPKNVVERESLNEFLQKHFLDNIPIFALSSLLDKTRTKGEQDGRLGLQKEIKEMWSKALGKD